METYYNMSEKDKVRIKEADAWSIENMAAHGADGRMLTYIGTIAMKSGAYDYYEDSHGCFWYKRRIYNRYHELVPEKEGIFNREGRKKARFRPEQRA